MSVRCIEDNKTSVVENKLLLSADSAIDINATPININSTDAVFAFKTVYANDNHREYLYLFGTSFDEQIKAVKYMSSVLYVDYDIDITTLIGKRITIRTGNYPDNITIDSTSKLIYTNGHGHKIFEAEVINANVIKINSFVDGYMI